MNQKLALTVVAAVLAASVAVPAFASQGDNADPKTLKGKATLQMVIPFAASHTGPTDEERRLLLAGGWVETTEGFVKSYPMTNATVSIEGTTTTTDNEGNYIIGGVKAGKHKVSVTHHSFEGSKSYDLNIDNYNKATSLNLSHKIDFMTFMEPVGSTETRESTASSPEYDPDNPYLGGWYGEYAVSHSGHTDATYGNQSYVTCNRFNGFLGNQTYYDKWAHPFASGTNFTQSDCDIAIGSYGAPCLNPSNGDYASDPYARYCKSFGIDKYSSATCSLDMSHRPLYHKHTSFSGPSGY